MASRKFKIAIAGCSRVATLHAKAVREIGEAELTGAWSNTPSKAAEFAASFGTAAYPDVATMVRECSADLVIVCSAHPYHADPAVAAAQAGAHVLIEKPLASDLRDCDRIIAACRDNGVKLGVISQRRWYEPVKRIRQAIDAGKLGNPAIATVTMLGWRDKAYYDSDGWRGSWKGEGGGVLVNQAPHQLDIMLWLMGEAVEVYGNWRNINHPFIEVEDTALAIVKFRNGGIGNILVSNSQKPGIYGKVHIHGDNGASAGVQTDGGAFFIAGKTAITEPPLNDIWTIPGEEQLLAGWVKEDADTFNNCDPTVLYFRYQIEDFIHAVREGRDPLVTGEDGRRTVELFTAIYRSSRDNRPVTLPLSHDPSDINAQR